MAERTLVIIKPDGIQRHLAGIIISRFEGKGFKLVAAKFLQMTKELAAELYAEHKDKPFYEGLNNFILSSPCLLMVWEADGVVEMVRKMVGATFSREAEPGTIRGDFGSSQRFNLVHGSDSIESAKREIGIFFRDDEIVNYELTNSHWLFGTGTLQQSAKPKRFHYMDE